MSQYNNRSRDGNQNLYLYLPAEAADGFADVVVCVSMRAAGLTFKHSVGREVVFKGLPVVQQEQALYLWFHVFLIGLKGKKLSK